MNLVTEQTATVLIVDDNPANLGVLSDALDQAGLEVWVAKSGKHFFPLCFPCFLAKTAMDNFFI